MLLIGDLKFVERGFEISDGGIKFRVADMHAAMGPFHVFALIFGGTTGGERDELNEMQFEGGNALRCGRVAEQRIDGNAIIEE